MLPTFCFLNDSKMYVLILEDSPSKTHSLKQKSPSVSLCAEDITASLQNNNCLANTESRQPYLFSLSSPLMQFAFMQRPAHQSSLHGHFFIHVGTPVSVLFCSYLGLNWTWNCWSYWLLAWTVLALPFQPKTPASLEGEVCCGSVAW